MIKKTAFIFWGGWEGHEPQQVAGLFSEILTAEGFLVQVTNSMDDLLDADNLKSIDLIVPVVTMSSIISAQLEPILSSVKSGVGLAGCHGGMCDAFRQETEWQFMTGGQWVAHPGNDSVQYTIHINHENPHEITEGIPDFEVVSEQYYLHTDPGNNVLAYTIFPKAGIEGPHTENPCRMPQVWTKKYGQGKVFYNALGHHRDVLEAKYPRELMRRGFLWAAR